MSEGWFIALIFGAMVTGVIWAVWYFLVRCDHDWEVTKSEKQRIDHNSQSAWGTTKYTYDVYVHVRVCSKCKKMHVSKETVQL